MKRGSIFETDGIPHMSEALPLAMQHVVAMIVGCVTPQCGQLKPRTLIFQYFWAYILHFFTKIS